MVPEDVRNAQFMKGEPNLRIGWAFFLLALIVAFAYGFNRGIYIGSSVVQLQKNTGTYYYKHCRYLFPSGVTVTTHGGWDTNQEAVEDSCLRRLKREAEWIVTHSWGPSLLHLVP